MELIALQHSLENAQLPLEVIEPPFLYYAFSYPLLYQELDDTHDSIQYFSFNYRLLASASETASARTFARLPFHDNLFWRFLEVSKAWCFGIITER